MAACCHPTLLCTHLVRALKVEALVSVGKDDSMDCAGTDIRDNNSLVPAALESYDLDQAPMSSRRLSVETANERVHRSVTKS